MNKFLPVLILVFLTLLTGCRKVTSTDDLKRIAEQESRVNEIRTEQAARTSEFDLFPFQELAIFYLDFTDKYPDAPESPDLLFKAGELYSQELNDIPRAIEIFTRNYEDYPKHETAPHALFLKAYLYGNTLRDYERAKKFYELFLEKYPQHELAKSATFEIEQMGVPPAELLRRLQSKNAEQAGDSTPKQVK